MKMKKRLRHLTLSAIALFMSMAILAQQRTITGKGLDADFQPWPAGTGSVKGKTTSTITNENGPYCLDAAPGAVIVFSYAEFTA